MDDSRKVEIENSLKQLVFNVLEEDEVFDEIEKAYQEKGTRKEIKNICKRFLKESSKEGLGIVDYVKNILKKSNDLLFMLTFFFLAIAQSINEDERKNLKK